VQFRWIFASNTAYFFGMMGQFAVRSVLAWELTKSPLALSYISLAIGIPMLLLAPIGGVIADRAERRKLIITGQLVILCAESTVCILLMSGRLAFWHLLLGTAVTGCVFPAISPARQAIIANIVGTGGLANAMALSMSSLNMAKVVGPAAVGLMIPTLGMVPTYGCSIMLYGIGFVSMFGVHRYPSARKSNASVLADFIEGVRYVRHHAPLRAILLLGLLPTCIAMPFQSLLIVFADSVWNVGAQGFGTMQAIAGLGGLLGTFIVAHAADSRHRRRIMFGSLLCLGLFLGSFASCPWFVLALPLLLLTNTFANIFLTMNNTIVHLLVSDEVRGRISSLLLMTLSLSPLGTVPLAMVADRYGAPLAVSSASGVLIVFTVVCFVASPTLKRIDAVMQAKHDQIESV